MPTVPLKLQLDVQRMHEIDPRNVESLFGMWTVFSRCRETLDEGKRLENLSWRLWGRETLLCPPHTRKVPALASSPATQCSGVPSLSTSVASDTDSEDARLYSSSSSQARIRKLSASHNSALSKSHSSEPHLTPNALERIVTTIQEKPALEPLSPSIQAAVNAKIQSPSPTLSPGTQLSTSIRLLPDSTDSSCVSATTAATTDTARQSDHRNSDTSVSSVDTGLIKSGSVVHGFSPAASSFRSSRARFHPSSPAMVVRKPSTDQRGPGPAGRMFQLGGGSSEDEGSSFEQSYRQSMPGPRPSRLSQTLGRVLAAEQKKTSYKDVVQQMIKQGVANDEGAIESDSDEEEDDDDTVDSAIEDDDDDDDDEDDDEDDDGDWEDDQTDEDKPLRETVFRRVDSRPNLTSRQSILTQGLTEGDRARGMLQAAHKSSPAIRRATRASYTGPSTPASPAGHEADGLTMQAPQSSKPLPIIPTTSNTYALAQSPRSTRRHMLNSELTQSLRQGILLERSSKTNASRAYLQRQAHSMANLQKAQERADQAAAASRPTPLHPAPPAVPGGSFDQYYDTASDYHAKGW